jgi:hypothetical protein
MRMFRIAALAAPMAVLFAMFFATTTVLGAEGPTKFSFGPFQNLFETVRPYVMVAFLALGLWVIINSFGRKLTGTLKSRPDGTASIENRASIGHLIELIIFVVVLEALVYVVLWYGLDLFGAAINLLQQAANTPPAN